MPDIELVMDVAEFCCHNLPDRWRSIGHDHGNIYPLFDQPVQTNTKSVLFHGYTAGRLCDLQSFHVDDFARVLFHDAVGHIFSRMTWGVAPKLVRTYMAKLHTQSLNYVCKIRNKLKQHLHSVKPAEITFNTLFFVEI